MPHPSQLTRSSWISARLSQSVCARLPGAPAGGSMISTTSASVLAPAPVHGRHHPMCAAGIKVDSVPMQKTLRSGLQATRQRAPTRSAHAQRCGCTCARATARTQLWDGNGGGGRAPRRALHLEGCGHVEFYGRNGEMDEQVRGPKVACERSARGPG